MSIVIKLSDLSAPQLEQIQTELKVHEKPNFFGGKNFYQNKNNFKDDVDLTIYHGKDYVRVPYNFGISLLGYNPQINVWKDHYRYPLKFIGQLRDYQQEICVEAGKHLNNHCSTILNVFASAGKTIMATYLATKCDYLRLIVYPGVDLGKQWRKTIQDFTFCTSTNNGPARVWMVGDKPPTEPVDFVLCPITRIEKIDPRFLSMIGMVIIDEFHLMYTQIRIRELLKISPKYIIGCTATLGEKKEIAHLMCGPEYVFMKSTKPFTVYKFYTGITMEEKENKSGTLDWTDYVKKQVTNPIRNEQTLGLCVTNPQKKICIMGWREEHINGLATKLRDLGENVDTMTGSKREYKNSRILCGTISKIGTGFDEANACEDYDGTRIDLLIMVGTMNNEVLIEQTAGHCFRANFPSIIYLIDNNKVAHKHWSVAEEWFVSRNGTVKEIYSKYAQANMSSLIPVRNKRAKKQTVDTGIVKKWDGKRLRDYGKKKNFVKREEPAIRDVSLVEHGIKEQVSVEEADRIKQMLEQVAEMGY